MMVLSEDLQNQLLALSNSKAITDIQLIQGVWGGYGQLLRISLLGENVNSVVIKMINTPQPSAHPKGWNSNFSHQRKLFSYQVESNWYQHYADLHQHSGCYLPRYLLAGKNETQQWLVLEDLNACGYPVVKDTCSLTEAKVCLTWLANFHVFHLQRQANGLWENGSYWHLGTRPDELKSLQDETLKQAAKKLDNILNNSPFQTLIHGDAKLANFCFSASGERVATVDFQYVGRGCGMKDVILFISSAVRPELCERDAPVLLDHYFEVLKEACLNSEFDGEKLVLSWRPLYAIAWADFQRFVKGWSPTHWKINDYTEALTTQALGELDAFE